MLQPCTWTYSCAYNPLGTLSGTRLCHHCAGKRGVFVGRDGQLSLEESWRLPSAEDVVQSAETGTEALSRAEEEQNLAEQPMDELEAMQARQSSLSDAQITLLGNSTTTTLS